MSVNQPPLPGPKPNRHLWWALSPAYTVGIVAFIPVVHAAIALRRRELWYYAAGLMGGDIIVWTLLSGSPHPDGSTGVLGDVGAFIAIVLAVVGAALGLRLRSEVFGAREPTAPSRASQSAAARERAVAEALASRKSRADAAKLAARDPALARDLMIGRPDLPREYDDGGLVDVNHVPESVLVSELGFSPEQARAVVDTREQLGRFESANDMSHLADVPLGVVDSVRDRIVAL